MHYSGALLLEARDGEFLDEHLCFSSTAASTQTQQPQQLADDQFTAGNKAADAAHGSEDAADTYDGYDNDGGGCDDGLAGDDYIQEDAAQGLQGLASGFRHLTCTHMLHRQMSMLSCVFKWLQKLFGIAAVLGSCHQQLPGFLTFLLPDCFFVLPDCVLLCCLLCTHHQYTIHKLVVQA